MDYEALVVKLAADPRLTGMDPIVQYILMGVIGVLVLMVFLPHYRVWERGKAGEAKRAYESAYGKQKPSVKREAKKRLGSSV